MQRLTLYLFRYGLTAFLFAAVGVSFVVLFSQSFRLLSFVIENSGTALIFLQLMGIIIPTFLPIVIPLSCGIGIVFVYHKFAVDSELVVMRAAGLSPLKLAKPALILGAIAVLLGYMLTLWITPAAYRNLVALQYQVRDSYSVFLVKPGAFNDLAEGLTFYARARDNAGGLKDLLIHDVRKPETPVTIMAETGLFTADEGVPQIIVFKGKRQEVDRETGHLSQLDFDRYVLDLQLLRKAPSDRLPDPREQGASDLLKTDSVRSRGTEDSRRAEFHQRLATPLLALTYVLIGLAAMLAGEFNRRGMAKRILMAAVAVVAVQAGTLWMASLISKHPALAPALYAVTTLPGVWALFILLGSQAGLKMLRRPTFSKVQPS